MGMPIFKAARLLLPTIFALAVIAATPKTALSTSAQIEWTEPVLVTDEQLVHGTAFIGILPGSDVFDTAGSLGVTFDVGQLGAGGLYLFTDIFTWIDNAGLDFEPMRVIYTLEAGCSPPRGEGRYSFFIKHQSFHDIDTFDDIDESYELYGARYRFGGSPQWYVRAGKYLNRSTVDYDWDLAASVTYDLRPIRERPTYAHAWVHHVFEEGDVGRDEFTDYAVELEVRLHSGLIPFLRYELLHDIDRFNGASDHHLMLGTRYRW